MAPTVIHPHPPAAPLAPGAEPARTAPAPSIAERFPMQPLGHLDALWLQVAGTVCNLRCTHCFVSCGPGDGRHAPMTRDEVRARVAEGVALGVREFYFTGGEPFLHPELHDILADTIEHGPCTVLTNGTLFTGPRLEALRRLGENARYSLEIRVSLDGWRAEEHDAFRGPGTFERTIEGLRQLEAQGLLPIVTVTRADDQDPLELVERYRAMLRDGGIRRPRLKVLPLFRLGRERERTPWDGAEETLAGVPTEAIEPGRLQCGSCRAVSSRGVFVCPLLVDEPGGRMGDSLGDALRPIELNHAACVTCFATGMTCGNA